MERHYFGARHGIAADSLSFAEVVESGENGMRGPLTTLLSVEVRVCAEPSRLCLRIQHWVIFRTRRRDSVLRKLECVTICNHLRLHNGTAFPALIESSFDAYSAGAGRAPLSVRKGRGVVTGGSLSPEQGTSDQPKVQGDDGSLERENVGPASWSACALVLPIASPTTLGLRAWRPCLAILWQVFRET